MRVDSFAVMGYGLPLRARQRGIRMNPIARILMVSIAAIVAWASATAQVIPRDDAANGIVTVVEYYNPALDHYFMTSLESEINLCNASLPPCEGWVRTGETFRTDAPGRYLVDDNPTFGPVCRLFNDSYAGTSTHFYALQGLGCEETLADFPDWRLETPELFDAVSVDADGICPEARFSLPIYRVFNNGMGGAPNHRYTTKYAIVQAMVAKGWVSEGYGPLGVVMCIRNYGP
jgi:hypothetical protein